MADARGEPGSFDPWRGPVDSPADLLSRAVLDSLSEGVILIDSTRGLIAANAAASRILGLDTAELESRTLGDRRWDCIFEDGRPMPPEEYPAARVFATRRPVEQAIMGVARPSGERVWISVNARPVAMSATGEVTSVVASFADITARRLTAAQAAAREALLRRQATALARLSLSQAVTTGGLQDAIAEITETASAILSVERVSVWLLSHSRARLRCLHLYERSVGRHTRRPSIPFEVPAAYFRAVQENRIVAAANVETDPRTRDFFDVYSLPLGVKSLLDAPIRRSGQVIGVICHESVGEERRWETEESSFAASMGDFVSLAVEARHRRSTERALLESEERMRMLAENLPGVAFSVVRRPGGDRRFLFVSHAWASFIGEATAARLGDDANLFRLLIDGEDSPRFNEKFEESERQLTSCDVEFRLQTAGGTRAVRMISRPTALAGGEVVHHGIMLDVSEHRAAELERASLERQLSLAQKYEAIGTLAAGVAHDVNNVLTAISCAAVLARSQLEEHHPARAPIGMIETACAQAHGVTRSLLTFASESAPARDSVDLRAVVLDFAPVLHRLMPASIVLRLSEPGHPLWIRADPVQLQQVLMNLVVNARDASSDGGVVTIDLVRDGTVGSSLVGLIVEDTGAGMTPEVRERVFDPFFTTKPRGKGTGLGLAVVLGIVRSHNARIDIDTAPGRGTRMTVWFPPADAPEASGAAPVHRARGDGITLLLAEDHAQVRELLAAGLQAEGFSVIAAADGAEAIEKAAQFGTAVDLAIVDADMPRVGGQECIRRLRAMRPDLPVIFVSGHPDRAFIDGHLGGSVITMNKPMTAAQLAGAILRLVPGRT